MLNRFLVSSSRRVLFSSSSRFASSFRVVEPVVVHEDVEAGRAVLVDIRATDDGIRLPGSERVPFEALVHHPDSEGASASADREALLAKLSEADLDADAYHAWGQQLLAAMEKVYGKKFTAQEAKKFFEEKADKVHHPKAFAQSAPKGSRDAAQFDAQPTNTQAQFAGKKAAEFKKMAAYNPSISKEELASSLSTEELARRAGASFAHLQDSKDASGGFRLNSDAAQSNVPRDRPVYLIDFAGVHAPVVAGLLESEGWSNVNVVDGGLDRWLMNGCDVELSGALGQQLESQLASATKNAPGGIQEIND